MLINQINYSFNTLDKGLRENNKQGKDNKIKF